MLLIMMMMLLRRSSIAISIDDDDVGAVVVVGLAVIKGAEDLGDGNCEAGNEGMEEGCAVDGLHSILSFFLSFFNQYQLDLSTQLSLLIIPC